MVKRVVSVLTAGAALVLVQAALAPAAHAIGTGCDPGWSWKTTENRANYLSPKFRTSTTNDRNYTVSTTFSVTQTSTYTYSVGASVDATVKGLIFGEVKASINGSITKSKAITLGHSVTADVPAHDTVHADYGARVEYLYGNWAQVNSQCQRYNAKYGTFRAPYSTNWHIY